MLKSDEAIVIIFLTCYEGANNLEGKLSTVFGNLKELQSFHLGKLMQIHQSNSVLFKEPLFYICRVLLFKLLLSNKQGDNMLTGPIPSELGQIDRLEYLNIGKFVYLSLCIFETLIEDFLICQHSICFAGFKSSY